MEVEKSASRAAEIANELAVFSQQEKQQARRVPPGNLNAVTQRCVEFFRNANAGQVIWHTQFERELFAARFDEAKVQQALTKILENAVEALDGAGQIAVQTRNIELTEATQDRNVAPQRRALTCAWKSRTTARALTPTCCRGFLSRSLPPRAAPIAGWDWRWFTASSPITAGGVAVSSQPGTGTSARVYLPAEKQFVKESAGCG